LSYLVCWRIVMMSARVWEWLRRVNLAAGVALLVLLGVWVVVPSVRAQTTLSSPAPSIAVGSSPFAMAVNPATGQVYVANNSSNTVSVINGATNMVTATVTVGTQPEAVAVNPVMGQVYVANKGSNNVSVIDGASNTVITTVPVGTQPEAVAVNPVTGQVYVANFNSSNVSVIDGASNTVITTVPVGTQPEAVAVNAVTGSVYVVNTGSSNVSVINGASNTVTTNVIVGLESQAVAVNEVTGKVYVPSVFDGTVSVIDGASNTVINTVIVGDDPEAVAVNAVTGRVFVANKANNNVSVISGATDMLATTITVGTLPDAVAVNAVTGQVYVTNQTSGTVSVINGATNTVTAVTVGSNPRVVTVNPVTGQAYVANQHDGTVSVIDGANNTAAAATVPVGNLPLGVAVNAVTGQVYVANEDSNTVSVIDGATNTATTNVTVGNNPAAVAVNAATGQVYVANEGGTVNVINGASNTVTTNVTVGGSPFAVAVNPVTGQVYVANGNDTVSVIDGATNAVTTVTVGSNPAGVAVNAVTGQVYVANAGSSNVSVIDGATNTVITNVTVGTQPQAVAVNAVTGQVYVANFATNDVSVIDGATNAVVATVMVGSNPAAVAVNAVTRQVYIANSSGNTVSVIDGASNTVAATVTVGDQPDGVAVNAVTGQVYVTNPDDGTVSVIDGQGTQGVPIGITTQASATVPSPYSSSAATATIPYITTFPAPSFTATATSSYTSSTAYSGVASAINPPLTALYYWLDDGSMSSWQHVAPSSATGSNPATFPIALSGKKPGFYLLYMFAAYGNEGTPWSSGNGTGNSPEISAVTAYPFYLSPIATTTVVQADVNPQGVNQNVTLTATVTPAATGAVATPTGTVNFYDGTTLLNTTPVSIAQVGSSNEASFQTSFSTTGSHSITAVFTTGDMNYFGSTSVALTENIETAPTVTGVSPASGPAVGGTAVAITGTNFTGANSVSFGGLPAASFTVNSATSITAISPAGTGTVDVVVTTPGGSSATSAADRFTYIPTLTLSSSPLPAATAETAYSRTLTASGGTAPYTYAVTAGALSAGLTLSSAGVVSGTPTAAGSFNVTVTVTDSSGSKVMAAYSLMVNAPTVTVSPASLPAATAETAYSQTLIASGGTGSYTYSATAGALPAGVVLSSMGVISGTPTTSGSFNFTVTAKDGDGFTGSNAYTLTVSAPTITVSPATLPAATAETAYSQTLTASGGTAPYTYAVSAGALPAGMSLNPSTGVLSGTPTAAGSFSFTITATDSSTSPGPYKGTATYTLIVNAGTATLTFAAVPAQTYGNPPFMVSARSASTGSITYSVVSGPATVAASTGVATLTGAGAVMIEASQAAAASYNSATAMTTIQAAKQATQTSVSASPTVATPVQTVTLTAAVSATIAGTPATPTGTVVFLDNGVQLGAAVNVVNGVAQLVVPSLPAGATAVITATYAGDNNFVGSMSNNSASVVVSLFDFTFTNTGTAAYTAAPGAMATYNFALAPLSGSYPGPVSFSVTGLPTGATASFTPGSVAVSGGAKPVVMTVQTASATAQNKNNSPFGRGIVLAFLLLPFVAKRSVREKMKGRMLLLVLLMAGLTATLTGCGSTNGFMLQSPQTYTLTVTATSETLAHSQTITLIVQ
jgi:YVTN family beta-propeller protein